MVRQAMHALMHPVLHKLLFTLYGIYWVCDVKVFGVYIYLYYCIPTI